jgi:hypothetical protein
MMMSSKVITILLLSVMISSTIASNSTTTIVSKRGKIKKAGEYKYFYDSSVPAACESVYIFGVGTAMSVNDYNELGSTISKGNRIVALVSDATPGNPIKLEAGPWERYYNTIVTQIQDIIPACVDTPHPIILFGGHSASGQGIINALPDVVPQPNGLIFLCPFMITKSMKINPSIPTLYWGSEKTTCFVFVNLAAKAAYELSSPDHRVLYRIDNENNTITHCIFTDNGCGGFICPKGKEGKWVIPAVSKSIHIFADDIVNDGKLTRTQFDLDVVKEDGKALLYVNEENPDDDTTSEL